MKTQRLTSRAALWANALAGDVIQKTRSSSSRSSSTTLATSTTEHTNHADHPQTTLSNPPTSNSPKTTYRVTALNKAPSKQEKETAFSGHPSYTKTSSSKTSSTPSSSSTAHLDNSILCEQPYRNLSTWNTYGMSDFMKKLYIFPMSISSTKSRQKVHVD